MRQSIQKLLRGNTMIEVDYGPGVLLGLIILAFAAPVIYGLFIDRVKAK